MLRPLRIVTGWARALKLIEISKPLEKLSQLRLRICADCPEAKKSNVLKIIDGHAKYEHQIKCGICKCPCLAKSLVTDEKCPKDKW